MRFGKRVLCGAVVVLAMPSLTMAREARETASPRDAKSQSLAPLEAVDRLYGGWLERLGEALVGIWEASRGIIVPGGGVDGTSSSTADDPGASAAGEGPIAKE